MTKYYQRQIQTYVLLPLAVGLFGLVPAYSQTIVSDLSPEVLSQIRHEHGRGAERRLENWHQLIIENQDRSVRQKLELVNDFFNRIRHKTDQEHWGEEDYWATPVEFLATNAGDCEDYTIAKYLTLRELGIPDSEMRLNYVRADQLAESTPHMVLTYAGENAQDPLVLDNLSAWIRPASHRGDLKTVYNFNANGLWVSSGLGQGTWLGESIELDQWESFTARFPVSP